MSSLAAERVRPTPAATRLLLITVALCQLIIGLDYNIVFVALPDIQALGFGAGTLQWVISAYAVAFGGLLLLGGRLVDHVGRRPALLAGLAAYGTGSLVGGLATQPALLIAGRVVQGAGGALVAPAALALVSAGFAEGRDRHRALAVWGGAGSGGMVLGSVLGGVLTQTLGWRAVFFVNVPLALGVALLLAARTVPAARRRRDGTGFDLPGAVLGTTSATTLVLGLTLATRDGWSQPATGLCLLVTLVATLAFVAVERSAAHPLVRLSLFRHRPLVIGTATAALFMATFGATAYFLTLYLQQTRSLGPLATGAAFIAPCLFVLAATMVGGRLPGRVGLVRTLATGLGLGALGCGLFAIFVHATTSWLIVFALVGLYSLGQGIVFTSMYAVALTGIAAHEHGVVSGIASSGQQLGGAVGLAVLVSVTAHQAAPGPGHAQFVTVAMALITGLVLATLALVTARPVAAS